MSKSLKQSIKQSSKLWQMLLWIVYPDEAKQTLLFKLFVRLIAGVICTDRGKMGTFVNKHDIHSFFLSLLLTISTNVSLS